MKIHTLIAAALLIGCTAQPPAVVPAPGTNKTWEASYSKDNGQSEYIFNVNQTVGGCSFAFPYNGHINYLTRITGTTKAYLQVQLRIDGGAKFIPLDGGDPATLHLYLEEGTLFNNWWCKTGLVLSDVIGKGVITLKVPLTPNVWSNVGGQMANQDKNTLAAFNRAIQKPWSAGMTFGGWSAYGHGVKIKDGGSAKFTLISYTFVN